MPRHCGPCQDKVRNELDRRLLKMETSHETYRTISNDFGYSEAALKRHKANHLIADLFDVHQATISARKQALQEVHQNELNEIKGEAVEGMAARLENAVGFLDQLKEVRRKTAVLLDQAENAQDLRAAGIFLKELREQIRLWAAIEDRLAIKNPVKVVNPMLVQKEADWIARSEEIEATLMGEFLRKYVVRIPEGYESNPKEDESAQKSDTDRSEAQKENYPALPLPQVTKRETENEPAWLTRYKEYCDDL